MEYNTLKSAKILGALSSLVSVLESGERWHDAACVSGLKQGYLNGTITLKALKDGVFPYLVCAIRDLTFAMSDYRDGRDNWVIVIKDYKYHLDQICKLL